MKTTLCNPNRIGALAVMLAIGSTGAGAAEFGDVKSGLAYAQKTCSQCHAVGASENESPDLMAPSFTEVANTQGITERALYVWLQSGNHEQMPNLMIEPRDLDNVIAYIMSLRAK
jgi:mono/diheme cytochrome c family protein